MSEADAHMTVKLTSAEKRLSSLAATVAGYEKSIADKEAELHSLAAVEANLAGEVKKGFGTLH